MACAGRIEIEPDYVSQFFDEFGIVGKLELAHSMRLETVRAPDPLDRTDAEAAGLGHEDAGPMGRLAWRIAQRQRNDALGRFVGKRRNPRGTGLVAKQAL